MRHDIYGFAGFSVDINHLTEKGPTVKRKDKKKDRGKRGTIYRVVNLAGTSMGALDN